MKIHDYEIKPILVAKDELTPDWNWISDSNRWTGFHLWYIYQNEVTVERNNEKFLLTEGDTFIFDLSVNHFCTQNPNKPAAMFIAYFHCNESYELQKALRSGKIPYRNHPQDFALNMRLFESAVKPTNTSDDTKIWLFPILHQILSSPNTGNRQTESVFNLCRLIDNNPQKKYSLSYLAKLINYSENQLIRLFKKVTGLTPYSYIIQSKITKAKQLLLFSDYTYTQIAEFLGYNDLNHFSSQFHKKTGLYPSEYVKTMGKNQNNL